MNFTPYETVSKWLWSNQQALPNGKLVYHGTCGTKLTTILSSGLRPRGNRPSEWDGQPSHPEMVYLTDSYPHVFGTQSLGTSNASATQLGRSITVAFEIDATKLDPRRMFPDEDYLVQKNIVAPTGAKTAHDVGKQRIREFQSLWRDSIRDLGTFCYQGRIPVSAFTAMTIFYRPVNTPLALLFPSHYVGLEEHIAEGKKYRGVNDWIFGRDAIVAHRYSRDGITLVYSEPRRGRFLPALKATALRYGGFLTHEITVVREFAVHVLGSICELAQDAIPALESALKDSEASVRDVAASILRDIRNTQTDHRTFNKEN